jgi:hypothetical protein
MRPSLLRFPMLVLVALGLAPGGAHVLELPVKMRYSPELYAAVTGTLYALFGSLGYGDTNCCCAVCDVRLDFLCTSSRQQLARLVTHGLPPVSG